MTTRKRHSYERMTSQKTKSAYEVAAVHSIRKCGPLHKVVSREISQATSSLKGLLRDKLRKFQHQPTGHGLDLVD